MTKNSQKFECIKCSYITYRKNDYLKHLKTIKHNDEYSSTNNSNENKNINNNNGFECECGNRYKYKQGFYKHKQKCIYHSNLPINTKDPSIILEVIQQNNEFKQFIMEQYKMLLEQNSKLIESCTIPNTNLIQNNVNSHNKTFNLQFFLNETCKNAMNISEFAENIQIDMSDLESVGRLGYVRGISDIIIKNLKALSVDKRPIHCSDIKREVLYIKDDDKWEKEGDDNKRLTKAIKYIANKNYKLISKFKDKYPDCIYSDSNKSDQYNKLIIEALGGLGDNEADKNHKIIRNIAKAVTISK